MSKRETRPGEVRCPHCGARLPISPDPQDGACRASVYCSRCGENVVAQCTAEGVWTLMFEERRPA